MALSEKIAADLKDALKHGDKDTVSVLRLVKAAMKNREIEKKEPLTDGDVQAILKTFVKRARESIEQFSRAGRTDLAQKETRELTVIEGYLPKQLGEEELKETVRTVIREQGASGPADLGRVMKAVMARIQGQADGKLVNRIVKEALDAQ
ncbi:MAG: GatB/YqeY domain-containing protein [Nitrospiraceae bacterium]|nr:MAG: GatB/YqeY domain-containing protein [Nitrospiraceae bacterium]